MAEHAAQVGDLLHRDVLAVGAVEDLALTANREAEPPVVLLLDLAESGNVRQAIEQADRAASLGTGLSTFGDEPARGLASLIDAATATAWAVGYLGDLMTTSEGPELMSTVRAWLDQHGQVDAAAQYLGIHRHTVRHRLRRAEAVLGRSLDDAAVRADLWFALDAVRSDDRGAAPALGSP